MPEFQTVEQVAFCVNDLLRRVADLEQKLADRDAENEKPKVTARSR